MPKEYNNWNFFSIVKIFCLNKFPGRQGQLAPKFVYSGTRVWIQQKGSKSLSIYARHRLFKICHWNWQSAIYWKGIVAIFPMRERVVTTLNSLKKLATQALISRRISSCCTERLTQLWLSEPKMRVKEEIKVENKKKEKI